MYDNCDGVTAGASASGVSANEEEGGLLSGKENVVNSNERDTSDREGDKECWLKEGVLYESSRDSRAESMGQDKDEADARLSGLYNDEEA